MKWRNLKVKCGSVISGREVPVGSECQFCILVLPTSIIVLHERSRKKTISEGKENRPWPFGDRSFQKKNRAFEGGWKQEPRRRCGTNRRIWLRMATDKIKVAVRVRPFNRRGKKKNVTNIPDEIDSSNVVCSCFSHCYMWPTTAYLLDICSPTLSLFYSFPLILRFDDLVVCYRVFRLNWDILHFEVFFVGSSSPL